jgi:hypothetical protein
MAIAYWTLASLTLMLTLRAFWKDRDAAKNSATNWAFIAMATLLWPVTLPTILGRMASRQVSRKVSRLRPHTQSAGSKAHSQSALLAKRSLEETQVLAQEHLTKKHLTKEQIAKQAQYVKH